MRKYKATREWGRGGTRHPSISQGRAKRRWPKFAGLGILLLAVFFVGKGFGNEPKDDVAVSNQEGLDIGGLVVESDTVDEILSGSVLSIPLEDAIVLDTNIEDEASIAQDTTAFSVSEGAVETNLVAVGDNNHGSGLGTIQLKDGSFEHVVMATLPDPPVGYFYEGWLVRSKPFDFFSTGRLIQHADDLKWYLLFDDTKDRTDYKKVLVTLEPDDGNDAPADHVLEGKF